MKHSIARQMTGVFVGLIVLVLAGNLLVNNFFLERYYEVRLQETLTDAYEMLNEHVYEETVDTDFFQTEFAQVCTSNNMHMVVLTDSFQVMVRTTDGNSDIMATRLFGYQSGIDKNDAQILRRTEDYTIQKMNDDKVNMGFLEMWGTLVSGNYFMMRIPLKSISANAAISNEFIMYISIAAVLMSVILVWWLSRRITKPIRELTDLSTRMAGLDFDAKYTSGGSDEIGQLGEHFNQMSEKLEQTISELKAANNELQRDIEKKTQIDEMRKDFLSNVSHELKTPLALISGYAEGLKECINDDAESREFYCDVIMDEAGKMNNMVKKLLTLNQLEFGNDKVEMERFDLAQLIQGKLASTRILAQPKGAELIYEGPETLHAWGDEFNVEEVLNNYLSNAINHVEGEMKIRVSAVLKDDKVRVTVFNTGQPIPEEDLDKLWVKFYKVDKARTREYGGSGVGLSIVKAIMDSMNQDYGVQNCRDGVEFWFELESAEAGN